MSPEQVDELRRNIDAVNCSNCGAAIDLAKESICRHCGSALSVLDATQAEKLVAALRSADRSNQPVDPALPLRLEQVRRETAQAFERVDDEPGILATLQAVAAGYTAAVRAETNLNVEEPRAAVSSGPGPADGQMN